MAAKSNFLTTLGAKSSKQGLYKTQFFFAESPQTRRFTTKVVVTSKRKFSLLRCRRRLGPPLKSASTLKALSS
jgi:hypothetical protein